MCGNACRCSSQHSRPYYFQRSRELIAYHTEQLPTEVFSGEIETDESYFGVSRKGKRNRGAGGKVPVFGLLKRGGKGYTQIIKDAASKTLAPIVKRKGIPDTAVYKDCWGL